MIDLNDSQAELSLLNLLDWTLVQLYQWRRFTFLLIPYLCFKLYKEKAFCQAWNMDKSSRPGQLKRLLTLTLCIGCAMKRFFYANNS